MQRDAFDRTPLSFDPEQVISNTHMGVDLFNKFLHENYCKFFGDIDDMCEAAAYLSDSDAVTAIGSNCRYQPTEQLSQYSMSIASRGLLYANRHPTPPQFRSYVKPADSRIRQTNAYHLEFTKAFQGVDSYDENYRMPHCMLVQSLPRKPLVLISANSHRCVDVIASVSTLFCETLPYAKRIAQHRAMAFSRGIDVSHS
jgi:hypothetical protein